VADSLEADTQLVQWKIVVMDAARRSIFAFFNAGVTAGCNCLLRAHSCSGAGPARTGPCADAMKCSHLALLSQAQKLHGMEPGEAAEERNKLGLIMQTQLDPIAVMQEGFDTACRARLIGSTTAYA
jgi:hypothetical protein